MQVNVSVQRDGEVVTMKSEKILPPKRLWNALILPYGCEADVQVTELSELNDYLEFYDHRLISKVIPVSKFSAWELSIHVAIKQAPGCTTVTSRICMYICILVNASYGNSSSFI